MIESVLLGSVHHVPETPPAFQASSFTCPHCSALTQQTWHTLSAYADNDGTELSPNLALAVCFACDKQTLWQMTHHITPTGSWASSGNLIWPQALGGPPPAEDLPDEVRGIYEEARAVVNASPRSASALLRLALEGVLEGLFPDAGNLNATIGAASAAGLPRQIIQAMDVLRFNGNAAIHEVSREDTPETAEALFKILNLVVERLITEPKQIAEMHASLPPGVLAQIEKRDSAEQA